MKNISRAALMLLAASLALAPSFGADPMPEQTPFEYFQAFCLANAGDPDKALAAADAAGWGAVKPGFLEGMDNVKFGPLEGRMLDGASGNRTLIIARGHAANGSVNMRMCSIMARPAQADAMDRVQQIAGGASFDSGGLPGFGWREAHGGHVALDRDATNTALDQHDATLRFVIVKTNAQISAIALMVPVP